MCREEQKKVLFVVYRTEWWGCFDSYCRQECARDDTQCFVLPVPRYERDEGTLKANFSKVHYEPEKLAAVLPEGACMADYREFSVEQGFERIYIHNPYENGSPMDTVDLKYYASHLKPYAKKLIYVSHLLGLLYADNAKFKAYDYVDAIFVPNENVKYTLETKYDKKAEVVPSGIPAYLERLEARLHGQEEAVGSEGTDTRRKLLYCVSFNDLLTGTEKQLAKMRDVFAYIKRNPEILLILRPDEDIQARRGELDPSIWEGYCRLVRHFVESGTGLLDQTPDLYEAAAMADGILSDGHPMTSFFSVQGKYSLHVDRVQRPVPTKEDRCIPILWAIAVEEREEQIELLFVPERTKLICRMILPGAAASDAASGLDRSRRPGDRKKARRHQSGPRVEIVAEVPDETVGGLNYMNVTKLGDYLYLSPYVSDGIWKCNLETHSFSKQYLPGAETGCIAMTFVCGRYLYMIPRLYPGIVKYDTETEEITVFDRWVEELERHVSKEWSKEPYFVWAAVQEGHMLYMASSKCDVWMEFDMEKDSWTMKSMGLPGKRFVHMVKDGDQVWLLPLCGDEIVLWNCRTGESRVVCQTVKNEIRNTPYSFCLDMGDSIAAFPQQKTDRLLVMEKTGLDMQKPIKEVRNGIPCGPEANLTEYQRLRNSGYQMVKKLSSGLILAYEYYDGSFLLLDRKFQVIHKTPCRLPIEAVRQQEDLAQKKSQIRGGFSGGISEGNNLPAMMEYFARHGRENREEIRRFHEHYYPR